MDNSTSLAPNMFISSWCTLIFPYICILHENYAWCFEKHMDLHRAVGLSDLFEGISMDFVWRVSFVYWYLWYTVLLFLFYAIEDTLAMTIANTSWRSFIHPWWTLSLRGLCIISRQPYHTPKTNMLLVIRQIQDGHVLGRNPRYSLGKSPKSKTDIFLVKTQDRQALGNSLKPMTDTFLCEILWYSL